MLKGTVKTLEDAKAEIEGKIESLITDASSIKSDAEKLPEKLKKIEALATGMVQNLETTR
jgi:hypothetical protein